MSAISKASSVEPIVETGDTDGVTVVAMPESDAASEGGKLKMIIQLVKRCLGVKDIAAM